MQMTAIILDITATGMLVRDESNGQEVMVFYRNPRRFNVGNRVRITYNGIMTMSVPPQITAGNIQILQARPPVLPIPPIFPPVFPSLPPFAAPMEIRAQVLRREQNFLIIRNNVNNQIMRVDTRDARFFCPGRQVTIRFSSISPGLPPRVNATDILPVC